MKHYGLILTGDDRSTAKKNPKCSFEEIRRKANKQFRNSANRVLWDVTAIERN